MKTLRNTFIAALALAGCVSSATAADQALIDAAKKEGKVTWYTALIVNRTGVTLDAARIIVKFANVAREKARAGLLTQPPSLRQLFAWARSVKKGLPVNTAFKNAIINKFPEDCRVELLGVYTSHINEREFKLALTK